MDTGQTSSPAPGEEEGGGQGSFASFSKEEETKDHTVSQDALSALVAARLEVDPCPVGAPLRLFTWRRGQRRRGPPLARDRRRVQ